MQLRASMEGMLHQVSDVLYDRAKSVFPGGTTRATITLRPSPIYVASAEGAYIADVDGNRYIDFANNFTTLIHGHAFAPIVDTVVDQVRRGSCFACPTESELQLAELLVSRVPSVDKVRFVNTGTEAVMFAIKAARAFTGKVKIAKFEGAYHGAYDWAEVSENCSATETGQHPVARSNYVGTPSSVPKEVVVLPFNDLETTKQILDRERGELAALLIDPMPSRPGLIPLTQSYVELLNAFCAANGSLLICDEVLNFRLHFSGAAQRFGLRPDLTTFGKIIGGGFPIGAIGGRSDVMAVFDNTDKTVVPQGGTFSANPVSMVAGQASMLHWDRSAHDRLEELGDYARGKIRELAASKSVPFSVSGIASLLRIHPKVDAPQTYAEFQQSPEQKRAMGRLYDALVIRGVLISNTGLLALSTPMGFGEIDDLVEKLDEISSNWNEH